MFSHCFVGREFGSHFPGGCLSFSHGVRPLGPALPWLHSRWRAGLAPGRGASVLPGGPPQGLPHPADRAVSLPAAGDAGEAKAGTATTCTTEPGSRAHRPPVPPRLLGSAVVRGVDTLGAGLGAGSPIPRGPAPTGLSPFISSLFAKLAPVFLTFSSGLLPAVRNMKSISPKSAQNTVQTNVFLAASLIQKSSLWPLVRPERCPARPGVRGPSPRPPRPSNA